jgi:hypothetical protein
MPFRSDLNVFNAGEIGRQVRARHDTAKYQAGMDLALNVLLLPGGGFYNRAGFRYASCLKDSTGLGRLFPFTFSLNQSYALEFTDELMRVYYDGGLVLRPELIVTGATNTDPLTVTIPDSGYEIGWEIYFTGQAGMTQLNGRTLTVTNVVGDVVTFGDVDATGWGVWTGSTGGVAGTGTPVPDPDEPLPPIEDDEPPPPTCVWAESWLAPGLMAGAARPGSPLRRMREDGSAAFDGTVDANYGAYAPGYRVTTETGVVATISDTAPVPTMQSAAIVYVKGMALEIGHYVAVEDADGFRWEAVEDVAFVGMIRVAKITTGNGIYGAGDIVGRLMFTHNIKMETLEP